METVYSGGAASALHLRSFRIMYTGNNEVYSCNVKITALTVSYAAGQWLFST
jgi:hypothetical protein